MNSDISIKISYLDCNSEININDNINIGKFVELSMKKFNIFIYSIEDINMYVDEECNLDNSIKNSEGKYILLGKNNNTKFRNKFIDRQFLKFLQ